MIRRIYAYIAFGLGVVVIIAGAAKLLPGGIMVGAALCFLGIAFFGLSFIPAPTPQPDAPPARMSFLEKLTGIFFEPSQVFRNIRSYPDWFAPLLLMVLLNFAYVTAFTQRLTPERIVNFTTDKVIESFNIPAPQAAQMKEDQVESMKAPAQVAGGAVTQFVGAFIVTCILAGLCMLGVMLLGGRIGFWQALSVLIYASLPVTIIGRILSFVILYLKSPDDIHPVLGQQGLVTDNLGALFSPAEHPVLFTAASFIGILTIYRVWLTATGLRNGGERVSSGTAWSISIAFWALGLLLSVILSLLFPQFIS
jgi:hypothetical protein